MRGGSGRSSSHRRREGRLRVLAAIGCVAVALIAVPAGARTRTAGPITDDWPTSLHDVMRTAASRDTHVSVASAGRLTLRWVLHTGGTIAGTPTVTGGVVYFGSWNGYEYAVRAATGKVLWKTFVGIEVANPTCLPPKLGPSSPATVTGGIEYVGGADGYWYALNAKTGAVEWRVWTSAPGVPGVYDGHYNWSGPLIVGNYAYVGVASEGDCPLVQGKLLKVDLTTHAIVGTLDLVPSGFVGGGIWTSPAYDPSNGLIYTATATRNMPAEQEAEAFLAIDPVAMRIVNTWSLPAAEEVTDSDFSTSTILYTDQRGERLVAAQNKNGKAYALSRDNLSAGPLWRQSTSVGGQCPTCDDGTVSSGTIGAGHLYMAGNRGVIGTTEFTGTVRALDPASGAYVWQHPAPGLVIGALAYDNGMVLDGGGSVFEVLNATNGRRLYGYDTGSQIYAGPSVADGMFFTGNVAGNVYAFALPRHVRAAARQRSCPPRFSCQDIGRPKPHGGELATTTAGVPGWSLQAGGVGLGGALDGLHLISARTRGDVEVRARVSPPSATAKEQVGVMIRQRGEADAPYYAVEEQASGAVVVQYRETFGAVTKEIYYKAAKVLPRYLMIVRSGDTLEAATSMNGGSYRVLPGTTTTIPLPYSSMAGVWISSGSQGVTARLVVSAVYVGAPRTKVLPAKSAHGCPAGYTCGDIGDPELVGDQQRSGARWLVRGSGGDIWSTADQFHFVWRRVGVQASVSALLSAQDATNPDSKAGLMVRGGSDANAPYYAIFVTPGEGLQVQERTVAGGLSSVLAAPAGAPPVGLRIVRSGTTLLAESSLDGVSWTPVSGSQTTIPALSGRLIAGLAVTSHDTGRVGAASFQSVAISG